MVSRKQLAITSNHCRRDGQLRDFTRAQESVLLDRFRDQGAATWWSGPCDATKARERLHDCVRPVPMIPSHPHACTQQLTSITLRTQ